MQLARNVANGSAVMRLPRLNPNGLKELGRGHVMGVGDKRDRHPGTDGLIFRADMPHLPPGPVGEDKSACDRHHEGEPDRQRTPPRIAHNSI